MSDKHRQGRILTVGALVVLGILASGCTGSRVTTRVNAPDLESRLRSEIRTWEGTPHRWGGETRAGADCSGFVMRVYADALNVALPRTTESQAQVGSTVATSALSPGDLVFFRTAPKTRHVGIYLSDGEFAHASTSSGVTVSHLEEDYWQRTYWMSRRVLPGTFFDESSTPERLALEAEPPREQATSHIPTRDAGRFGW